MLRWVNPSACLQIDPFIQAIETMNQAIAHVDCLAVSGVEPELIDRVGSAFFISEAGEFVTAAHVIREMPRSKALPELCHHRPCRRLAPGDLHRKYGVVPVQNLKLQSG